MSVTVRRRLKKLITIELEKNLQKVLPSLLDTELTCLPNSFYLLTTTKITER
jgi:hypothetical protein